MLGKHAVDVQLNQLLGLTIKEIEPILAVGGDSAEKSSWNAVGVYGRRVELNW